MLVSHEAELSFWIAPLLVCMAGLTGVATSGTWRAAWTELTRGAASSARGPGWGLATGLVFGTHVGGFIAAVGYQRHLAAALTLDNVWLTPAAFLSDALFIVTALMVVRWSLSVARIWLRGGSIDRFPKGAYRWAWVVTSVMLGSLLTIYCGAVSFAAFLTIDTGFFPVVPTAPGDLAVVLFTLPMPLLSPLTVAAAIGVWAAADGVEPPA